MKNWMKTFFAAAVVMIMSLIVATAVPAQAYIEEVTITDIYGELNDSDLFANLIVRTDCLGDAIDTVVNIYDKNGTELFLEKIESSLYKSVFVVPNKSMEYVIKAYLLDGDGNQISEVVTQNYTFEKCDVLYGYVASTEYLGGIGEEAQVLIYDEQGNSTIYKFGNPTYVNGTRKVGSAITNDLPVPVYAAFVLNSDSTISRIAYTTEQTQHLNVNYDEETADFVEISRGEIPVFYVPDGAEKTYIHTLSDGYLYNLAVCDYAVVITSIQSKSYDEEIETCEIEAIISSGFSRDIIITLNTSNEAPKAQVKLYDTNKTLITQSDATETGEDYRFKTSFEVANENKKYIVEVCIVDETGNRISDVQTFTYSFKKCDILYGTVTATGYNSTAAGIEVDGSTEYFFKNNETVWIDGEHIDTAALGKEAVSEKLKTGCAEFVLNEDGDLYIINFADYSDDERTVFSYPSASGNTVTSIHIMPTETADKAVICALYNKGVLSDVMVEKSFSERMHFLSEKDCDSIKFMLWENLNTLVPVNASKEVNTLTWN